MKSFREWKRGHVAEKKGALEELRLAIDYYKGNGLPQSYEQAIAWAKKGFGTWRNESQAFFGRDGTILCSRKGRCRCGI